MLRTRPRRLGASLGNVGLHEQIRLTGTQLLTLNGLVLALSDRQQLKQKREPGATTMLRFNPVVVTLFLSLCYDTIMVLEGVSFLRTLL